MTTPTVTFKCRRCEGVVAVSPSQTDRVLCPHCKGNIPVFMSDSVVGRGIVTMCVSCGHDALYVQKDFNRQVGMAVVGLGIAASIYFFARSQPLLAMGALGLTALIDFLAYILVREVTVC